jgi:hypothetical protein
MIHRRVAKTMALTKERDSRVKRKCLLQWLAGVILTISILCPAVVSGRDVPGKGLMTNVALMEKATSAAVDSLVRALPSPLRGPVYLRAATPHDATWMIENLFGGRLREKGIEVIVSAVPSVSAFPDTSRADTAAVNDSLKVRKASVAPRSETELRTLEYRITELGMEYPRTWRPGHVGHKMVERVAVVSLYGRLIEESSGKLLWVGEGSATKRDVVPASELSFLEGKSMDWQKGTLPAGKLGTFVEPLVVAAIVAGLVYLFYSNKE